MNDDTTISTFTASLPLVGGFGIFAELPVGNIITNMRATDKGIFCKCESGNEYYIEKDGKPVNAKLRLVIDNK